MTTESEMLVRAQQRVLRSARWVSENELHHNSAYISDWLAENMIFSIRIQGTNYFSLYCFNTNGLLTPLPGLKPIIQELRKKKDDWGIAYWFCGANGYLGGHRPQDLVQHQPDLVLEAARDEILGITHG